MSWISADEAYGENHASWCTWKSMGCHWSKHVLSVQKELFFHCRLWHQVPSHKKTGSLLADSIKLACKIYFSKYRFPTKIMSDVGGNFISEKFKEFHINLNIQQAVSSSYHHKNNWQLEACIKFIKQTLKKCLNTNTYTYLALLQVTSTPPGPGLPSPVTLLYNHPVRNIMPVIKRELINANNNDDHYGTLVEIQVKGDKKCDTHQDFNSLPIGSTNSSMERWGTWTNGTIIDKGIV